MRFLLSDIGLEASRCQYNDWTSWINTSHSSLLLTAHGRSRVHFNTPKHNNIITAPLVGTRIIAIRVPGCPFICLSVCPLTYLQNHTSKFHQTFCTRYLWSWLGPSAMAMQYVIYTSGFVDDVMLSHNGANGPESNTTRIIQFAMWRHRGRSPQSPTVYMFLCKIFEITAQWKHVIVLTTRQ